MASTLFSDNCRSVAEASRRFASEKGLLVLRPGRGCCGSLWFSIPSGCYALVTSHGADLEYRSPEGEISAVWPAGLHCWFPPWVGVSNLVTKQSIVLDLPVKACKTQDNVTVNVDVALVFRIMGDTEKNEDPELVRKFVYQVKPRGLEQQLRDAQEEAVRGLARSLKHTEIYGIRSGGNERSQSTVLFQEKGNKSAASGKGDEGDEDESIRDDIFVGSADAHDKKAASRATSKSQNIAAMMKDRLNTQFVSQGVEIQSVTIKSVKLPADIMSQMTEKTLVISQNAQQRINHENEMQDTRMEEQIHTMLQSFHEQREQEKTVCAETMNMERVKLNDARAQALKAEANIREDTKVKLEKLRAENALEVQRVKNSTTEAVAKIEADARKICAELIADTKLETHSILAESKLVVAKNVANADRASAQAEGVVAKWLEKKNEHVTREKQICVYDTLAQNDDLVLTASSDEGTNLVALADAILQNDVEPTRASIVLSEMALLGQASSALLNPTAEGQGPMTTAPSESAHDDFF